jgi:KDO2-lipid IV(A) lauroyltransferase
MAGHQCNWEWLLVSGCSQLPMPIDAVYKKINNKAFEKLMFDTRAKFGGKPIEMQKAFREIVKRKKIPRCFAMVADQSPMPNDGNLWLSFLNQEAPFFQGADRFAKMLKYPVGFMGMRRIKRGHYEIDIEILSEPPYAKNSKEIIEMYRDRMEEMIRKNPSDWLWSHRRWKHKKPELVQEANS